MNSFVPAFASLLLALTATPQYSIDLARYFATPTDEVRERRRLNVEVHDFLDEGPPHTASALLKWLDSYNAILRSVQRHDVYVYLRAERDIHDGADAKADDELVALQNAVNDDVDKVIGDVGRSRLERFVNSSTPLTQYRYFLETSLVRSAHRLAAGESRAVSMVADPATQAISASYKSLRRSALATQPVQSGTAPDEIAFHARWAPFAAHEDGFAAMLVSLASIRNGVARLRGFDSAPDWEYAAQSLSGASVQRALDAVRRSGAYRRYQDVLAVEAARRLHVDPNSIPVWALNSADSFKPPDVSFVQATTLILSAEQPMGKTYADAYAQLFDPARRRVDLCTGSQCDQTGFSVGFSGLESGIFYGGYTGSINNVRATAHEAGHAVHRQFMSDHQPLAIYNTGPNFMFESFAIFNELLFYDHLYKTASTQSERAYYLNRFLDDATFQIFGSAEETDLEAKIYQGTDVGRVRSADDLDTLTLQVLGEYTPRLAAAKDVKDYWARDSLYYTDPLYDVSYLYAGMLALSYFSKFERDAPAFSAQYVALLENGFTDSPASLERRYLGIDLTNEAGLIENAGALIDGRTAILKSLYAHAPI
jgi:oligoendopeptidase F